MHGLVGLTTAEVGIQGGERRASSSCGEVERRVVDHGDYLLLKLIIQD